MTTLTTHNPIAIATPRGAAWAAAAWTGVSHGATLLLNLVTQSRERAAVIGRTTEANRLRHVAQGFMSSDPRFAADLFAAADRHERAE
jgi:hypothetical protein